MYWTYCSVSINFCYESPFFSDHILFYGGFVDLCSPPICYSSKYSFSSLVLSSSTLCLPPSPLFLSHQIHSILSFSFCETFLPKLSLTLYHFLSPSFPHPLSLSPLTPHSLSLSQIYFISTFSFWYVMSSFVLLSGLLTLSSIHII